MRGETVIRIRETPGGSDIYGDPVAGTEERCPLDNWIIGARYSNEPTDRGRQGVIVGLTALPPPCTDLLFTDKVEVRGDVYQVDGEPFDWHAGLEVALKKAIG